MAERDEPDWEGLLLSVDAALMQLTSVRRQVERAMGVPADAVGHQHEPVQMGDEWYCASPTCGLRLPPDAVGVSGDSPQLA